MSKQLYSMGVSKSERLKWQAEDDATTMANYQEIMNDKARMGRAIKVANERAKDLQKRATAMQSVARIKGGRTKK